MNYPNPFLTASATELVQAKVNGILYMSDKMMSMSEAYSLMSHLNHSLVVRCFDDVVRCVSQSSHGIIQLKPDSQALHDGVDAATGVLNVFGRMLTPKVIGVLEEQPERALVYFYDDGIISLMNTHSSDEAFTVQLLRQIHSAA
ncbi:hypothetical protein QTV44_002488 [Vibrio vulnificus]|nr:hypothetical protein [Vibrio vulnificus]